MSGRLVYVRTPKVWDEKAWREAGAFAAVFLNYNKIKSIRRAVEATLVQDFSPLEILFMDDASTDGSAEVMEELVRAYRGPHKVSVVRNASNVGICGQWNQVTKFSEAEWFGMFCGDDYAHADRVTVSASVIARYPNLLGLSTSMIMVDVRTGKPFSSGAYPEEEIALRGDTSPVDLFARRWPSGCTSFWRRKLFETPLVSVAFDDLLIFWRLHMLAAGRPDAVWVYDGLHKTVDYSIGEGLWSEMKASRDPFVSEAQWIRKKSAAEFKVYGRYCEAWCAIRREALQKERVGKPFVALANRCILHYGIRRWKAWLRPTWKTLIRFLHKVWRKLGTWCSKGAA